MTSAINIPVYSDAPVVNTVVDAERLAAIAETAPRLDASFQPRLSTPELFPRSPP